MSAGELADRTETALAAAGLSVTPGSQPGSFRVDADGVTIVVIALSSVDTVACYTVWPDDLDPELIGPVAEAVVLGNTTLHSSALELSPGSLGLSGRAALASCSRIDDAELFTALLGDVVAESRRALAVHAPVIEAVLGGQPVVEAFALRLSDF